jgi:hypothetical protein
MRTGDAPGVAGIVLQPHTLEALRMTIVASIDLTPTREGVLLVEVLARPRGGGLAVVEDVLVVDRPTGHPEGSPLWVVTIVEEADAALRDRGWRTGAWVEDDDTGRHQVSAQVARFPGLLP